MAKSFEKQTSEFLTGASLSKKNFDKITRLPRDEWEFDGHHEQIVAVRGLPPKEIICVWETHVLNTNGSLREIKIALDHKDTPIVDFWFKIDTDHSSSPLSFWALSNRYVKPSLRGKGIGSFGLKTAEKFIRQLHQKYPQEPTEIRISTTRPSLVEFMLRNGYVYLNDSDESAFKKFLKEREEFQDTPAYKKHRELPSFLLVRFFRDNLEQDNVLIDKNIFSQIHGEHTRLADIFEQDSAGRFVLRLAEGDLTSQPDTVRIRLRKDVSNVQ